jgi:hypothetical protein
MNETKHKATFKTQRPGIMQIVYLQLANKTKDDIQKISREISLAGKRAFWWFWVV